MFSPKSFVECLKVSCRLWLCCMAFAASLSVGSVRAEEFHAGDIDLEIDGNKLITHNGRYFESELVLTGTGASQLYRSEEPGFVSAPGLLAFDPTPEAESQEEIGFNVLGPLLYWDGGELTAPASGLNLNLLFGLASPVTVSGTSTGVTTGFSLGAATDPNGEFHQHFVFEMAASAPMGAYGVLLELTPAGLSTFTKSDPFLLVFNRGLTDPQQFEAGVDAMVQVTAVPEPSSIALAGLGVAGLAGAALRRRMWKH